MFSYVLLGMSLIEIYDFNKLLNKKKWNDCI